VSDDFDATFDAAFNKDEFGPDAAKPKPNGTTNSDRLRLVPPSEMDWRGAELNLIKGILGCAMMALLYGESGSAKTLIAISMAMHVALGRDWCGHRVKQGLVVYLAPEGCHSVHLRFHAWCHYHSIDPTDDSLLFRTVPVQVDLCTTDADLTEIIAHVKAAETELGSCVLVVVDTVSRALAGADENASNAMGCFIVNCDRLREETHATVLAVHHTPRDGTRPRGSTVLEYGSEIRMAARKIATGLFALSLEHLKDGEAGEELMFSLHRVVVGQNDDGEDVCGGLVTKATISAAGAPGRPQKLTDRQLRILQELEKQAATTKRWEFTTEEFKELCVRSGAVEFAAPEGTKRRLFAELKTQLANKGYVAISGDAIRLVRQD
jgi:hypothetical protein